MYIIILGIFIVISAFYYYLLIRIKWKLEKQYNNKVNASVAWIKIKKTWYHIYISNEGIVYLDGVEQGNNIVPMVVVAQWERALTEKEIKLLLNM